MCLAKELQKQGTDNIMSEHAVNIDMISAKNQYVIYIV